MANARTPEINVYIDDIPMKLSDKYRPIDFSAYTDEEIEIPEMLKECAELYALEVSELREKEKMQQLLNSMASTRVTIKDNSRSDSSGSDSDAQNSASPPNEATITKQTRINAIGVSSVHHHLHSGEILKPQQSQRTNYSYNNTSERDNNRDMFVKSKVKTINPKDFENDTCSPFDNVELQTLDDMRELNSVFQAVHGQNEHIKNNDNRTVNESHVYMNNSSSQSQSGGIFNHMNGVNESVYINLQMNTSLNDSQINCFIPYQSNFNMNNSQQLSNNVSSSFTHSQTNALRSSKSASDLPTLFNSELPVNKIRERSHTPPCKSSAINKRHINSRQKLILNDPYEELSRNSKDFVNSICMMGYDKSRVSRAVKHLNNDEKRVFDFLLQVQALEEEGYDCYEAEIALHMNNCQILKARKFLDSLKQLSEVGFDKEAIVKALIKCDNDRDKALDSLLTTEIQQ